MGGGWILYNAYMRVNSEVYQYYRIPSSTPYTFSPASYWRDIHLVFAQHLALWELTLRNMTLGFEHVTQGEINPPVQAQQYHLQHFHYRNHVQTGWRHFSWKNSLLVCYIMAIMTFPTLVSSWSSRYQEKSLNWLRAFKGHLEGADNASDSSWALWLLR